VNGLRLVKYPAQRNIAKHENKIPFQLRNERKYEGWNFNSGKYLFTTDTK